LLVGTTKVYPAVGADIVMQSITLRTRQGEAQGGVVGCKRPFAAMAVP